MSEIFNRLCRESLSRSPEKTPDIVSAKILFNELRTANDAIAVKCVVISKI